MGLWWRMAVFGASSFISQRGCNGYGRLQHNLVSVRPVTGSEVRKVVIVQVDNDVRIDHFSARAAALRGLPPP